MGNFSNSEAANWNFWYAKNLFDCPKARSLNVQPINQTSQPPKTGRQSTTNRAETRNIRAVSALHTVRWRHHPEHNYMNIKTELNVANRPLFSVGFNDVF